MKEKKRLFKSDLGATIVEGAIILPVMLLLFFACFDVFRAISLASALESVAYEAGRVASAEEGLYASNTDPSWSDDPNVNSDRPSHYALFQKIDMLIARNNDLNNFNVRYSTDYIQEDPADPTRTELVRVEFQLDYPFLFKALPTGKAWFNSLMIDKELELPKLN